MKFTTTAVLLAAAMGATAHPSHGHKRAHRSLEARGNFVMAKKPVLSYPTEPTTTAAAVVPTTEAAAPTTADEPSTTLQQSASKTSAAASTGSAKAFCDGVSYTKSYKRATLADISYKGNIGAPGNYGCNWMTVDADTKDSYKYLTTFTNAASSSQQCKCFNKIGPVADEINGFFNGNEALTFTIGAGEKKYVVVDENTQGGCACGHGSVPLTTWGEFASTWLELDMGSDINDGWSGADASCLVSAAEGLDIPGLKVCGHGTCSTINPGGTGTNAYLGGMEAEDGIGLNINSENVRLEVTVGYSGN